MKEPAFKEVSVTVSRTFNLGSYESCRVETTASASVGEGESIVEVAERMLPYLRKVLLAAYNDHVDGKGRGKEL